jgi:hypothetical protein
MSQPVNSRRASALSTLSLMLSSREWLHARREAISLKSASTVRREVQVDFSLRGDRGDFADEEAGSYVYLPLAFIRKDHEAGSLVVQDETGARVPTLSEIESKAYAFEMLSALLDSEATDSHALDENAELKTLMLVIASAQPSQARVALDRLLEVDLDDADGGYGRSLLALAKDFTESFPLLVEISAEDPRHRSLIFTTSPSTQSFRRGLRAIPRRLGWAPSSLWIAVPNLSYGRVYEITVDAPEGASISSARLLTWGSNDGEKTVDVADSFLGPTRTQTARLGITNPSAPEGWLVVELAPSRSYIAGALAVALLAAVMLTVGRQRLGVVTSSVDAATTLLLAGPTLFSTVVARPGRGTPADQLLVAARGVLVLAGVLTFLAAGSLVTVDSLSQLQSIWLALTLAAWVSAAILLVSLVSPVAGRRASKARRGSPIPHRVGDAKSAT